MDPGQFSVFQNEQTNILANKGITILITRTENTSYSRMKRFVQKTIFEQHIEERSGKTSEKQRRIFKLNTTNRIRRNAVAYSQSYTEYDYFAKHFHRFSLAEISYYILCGQ